MNTQAKHFHLNANYHILLEKYIHVLLLKYTQVFFIKCYLDWYRTICIHHLLHGSIRFFV